MKVHIKKEKYNKKQLIKSLNVQILMYEAPS